MIDIYWLFILTCLFLVFELLVLKIEYSAPGFIFTASFVICSACSFYLAEDWGIEKIQFETFSIIILSNVIFLVVEEIFRVNAKIFKEKKIVLDKYQEKHPINISKSILYVTIILGLICILWSILYIVRYISAGNWNAIMAMYKNVVNTDTSSLGLGKKMLNQFNKVLTALNYILLFVFNYNLSCKKIPKNIICLYIISFIEYMVFRLLLSGGRQSLLFFVIAWFTISIICKTFKENENEIKKANRKYMKNLLIAVVIIFPLFYFLGRFVGRKESDVLYAATSYLATGIYGFEWEVKNHYASTYWGEISFPGLYPILKFLGVIPLNIKPQSFLPFFWHGNTVSMLGRWYWDFGTIGVYIITLLVSISFSYLYYYKIRYAKDSHERNRSIIVYGYLVHILYFAGYDDFVMNILSLNFVLTIIIIYLFYEWIVKRHIKLVFRKQREN